MFKQLMNVLILGTDGMLGSYISFYLRSKGILVPTITRKELDIFKLIQTGKLRASISAFLLTYQPTIVINCIGVINKRVDLSLGEMYMINGHFPIELGEICSFYNYPLIHASTDCVFSGKSGWYREDSLADPIDDYGISKAIGDNCNACIIRTSIIGRDVAVRSFLEWVISMKGRDITGYSNHTWNGITCLEYAKFIYELITSKRPLWKGVKHVGTSEDMSKADLIELISNIYNLDLKISKVKYGEDVHRSLLPSIIMKPITIQLKELREWHIDNDKATV